jgi:benzoyl-CoA 2,3-dioxygenase component B
MTMVKDGVVAEEDVPLRNAMNEVLRDEYVEDCQRGVDRWNKRIEEAGIAYRLRLPSKRFYRHIGLYADMPFDANGQLLSRDEWKERKGEWLPTDEDRAYVRGLQKQVVVPGQIANWLAKPARGIKGLPFEYEYVRLD